MTMADGSQKEFEFVANGMTQYRYRQLTKHDLTKDMSSLINGSEIGDDADFTIVDKLAYIMNMSAVKADMNKLNEESFFGWIEQFDSSNSIKIAAEMINLYYGNKESTSESKKKDEEQTET